MTLCFLKCHVKKSKKKRIESVVQAFTFLHFEIANGHFHCKTITLTHLMLYIQHYITRSQAVARIADRTASQHLRRSRDVIGHVTSPSAISYWWSFGTESLNPVVFEILRSKRIGVTSLTFQGHVTSSVT